MHARQILNVNPSRLLKLTFIFPPTTNELRNCFNITRGVGKFKLYVEISPIKVWNQVQVGVIERAPTTPLVWNSYIASDSPSLPARPARIVFPVWGVNSPRIISARCNSSLCNGDE